MKTLHKVGAAIQEEMPCMSSFSKLWNIEIGQNNVWSGPTWHLRKTVSKANRKPTF